MGRAIKIDVKGFEELRTQITNIQKNIDEIMGYLTKDIAALLLRKVIKRTPVGDYDNDIETYKRDNKKKGIKEGDLVKDKNGNYKRKSYKSITYVKDGKARTNLYYRHGGNLRRNWTVGEITKNGNTYNIEVINPTEYASYIEFGHMQEPGRFVPALGKKLKKAWVPGRFMLTISENEIKNDLENILSHRLERALKKVHGND